MKKKIITTIFYIFHKYYKIYLVNLLDCLNKHLKILKSDNMPKNVLSTLKKKLAITHERRRLFVKIKISNKIKFLFFPVFGIISILWFLIRVVPKPSRATYPCQRVAAGIGGSFLAYLISTVSALRLFRQVKKRFSKKTTAITAIFCILFAVGTFYYTSIMGFIDPTYAAVPVSLSPNIYEGTARGIKPGRVSWAHDPDAVSAPVNANWWEDQYNDQDKIDALIRNIVINVAAKTTESEAWDSIFKYFNTRRGKGNVGYQLGEKIAIKINLNNTSSHNNNTAINASPHMVIAVLKSLIFQGGIPEANITVGDPSRYVPDAMYNKIHDAFPKVVIEDHVGGDGRSKATFIDNVIKYSVEHNVNKQMSSRYYYADYLINIALLKGHVSLATVCGKNWFGLTGISTVFTENVHYQFGPPSHPYGRYTPLVDWMGHENIGENTLIFFIDGLYGNKEVGGNVDNKWSMEPFNNHWPASIFASLDMVAIDSVALDFLLGEFGDSLTWYYPDTYLREAANPDPAPSGTNYDPEQDGIICNSLGVVEHWNSATDKKYSRNLGSGNGIELIKVAETSPPVSESIAIITAPKDVIPGQIYTVGIDYEAGDTRDLYLIFRNKLTKVRYYEEKITVSPGNGSKIFNPFINPNTSAGQEYDWLARLSISDSITPWKDQVAMATYDADVIIPPVWTGIKRLTWSTGSSINPDLAVDSDQNIHLVWQEDKTGNYEIYYKKSTNNGDNWMPNFQMTYTSGISENPVIAVSSEGEIYVIWSDSSSGNAEIFYRKSPDGGIIWQNLKRLTWNAGDSKNPQINIDSNENIHVVWQDTTPGNNEIYYLMSTDKGSTWGSRKRLTWTPGHSNHPKADTNSAGDIYVFWDDNTSGNAEIHYKKSTDASLNWSLNKRLTYSIGNSWFSDALFGSTEKLYVFWDDLSLGNSEIRYIKSSDYGSSWSAYKQITWNSGNSWKASVCFNQTNEIHIVWNDFTPGNSEIFYKYTTDMGLSWEKTQRLTWNSGESKGQKIESDNSGNIFLVWHDNTWGNYEIIFKSR